ncbi:hypothetical protein, partial [Vibrio marisflavi]|uniref:hypothetical protein n=1 Tax=Vibrio marisflavi TaxID=1216040 RepID=UPI001F3F62E9
MTEKNATNAKIDQHTVNLLLAAKDQADMKMRTALSKHAFYSESVTTSGDADLFDERIVCVLSKSKITQRIIEKVNTLKQANEELLEAAPMYFSRSSNAFKEPLLLNNVVQLHLTINTAVNSRKCTSKQLIKRLARLERETEAKILSAKNDLPLLDELETKLVAVRAEKEQLEKQPNK